MVKGFINFRNGRIPFVVEDYRMELFTDESLLTDFIKEYNFKSSYVLYGQCFRNGICGQKATFLVEHNVGSVCYLCCYIIDGVTAEDEYDTIGIQSPFLDDIFRYKYNYLDMVRKGTNLAIEPKEAYNIPVDMNGKSYELSYRMGHNNALGLLEDFDKKGELLLKLQTKEIRECYDISVVLYRLSMFMLSQAEVPIKRVTLYKGDLKVGWFYCSYVSEEAVSVNEGFFHKLDVMKYVPKILNNIALDSGNRITKSIPLGHLGRYETMFSTQRFIEQVMAFEYLFDKIDHKRAQNPKFTLKNELEYMFNEFPQLLSNEKVSSEEASNQIKELRRTITHGYAYYYDFKNSIRTQFLMVLLDKLIRNMSLWWIGFTKDEIEEYPIH